MRDNQRDDSIDRFLRRSFPGGGSAPGSAGACVEPEAIAAWTEGTLSSGEAAAVETHLAGCAACQQVLAVFARTAPPSPVSTSLWERWHLRWAVPIAAAATAVAVWVAVPDDRKASVEDAFTVSEPASPAEPNQPPAANAAASSDARERSDPPARRDTDSSLRAQAEKLEARPEKEEADLLGAARESAPASAAAPEREARPLSDSAATTAQRRQAASTAVEVISPDAAVRWRVLPTGLLERSTNAGQTWESVMLPQKVTAVRAVSAATAVVTTTDGRQFRTDDQGKTWKPFQP